jgi:hypothetical protein
VSITIAEGGKDKKELTKHVTFDSR